MAVTEHITGSLGPRTTNVVPLLAAGARIMPTRGWLLVGGSVGVNAVTGGAPGRFMDGRRGFGASGLMAPSGEWSGRAGVVRFARLIHRRGRVLGGPAVRAASGGNQIADPIANERGRSEAGAV